MSDRLKLILGGCLALLVAACSVAFAAGSGNGGAGTSGTVAAQAPPPGGPPPLFGPFGNPRQFAAGLAGELGVDRSKVEASLRSFRRERRAERRRRGMGGCRHLVRMCPARAMRALAAHLAGDLGRDRSEVLAAIKAVAKERVDKAVAAGFITERRGARIKARIDSGRCVRPRMPAAGPPPPPAM